MQTKLGKAVIVENKPGAGGILGNDVVAKAAPDGYTLGIMTAGQIIASVTKKNMPYDTLTAFAPVTQVATASLMIVARPDFPANNVKELVAAAKADPGKVVFASPGFAATQHFAGEMFKQIAGVNLLHVPFKTSPEAINAVLGKHADILFDTVSALIGQVQSGQLKALAVTGKDRFPAVPDVPPAVEFGRAARLRCHDLVRRVCAARHAAGRHRQVEQGAQRQPQRGGGQEAAGHRRRGGQGLDARGVRDIHGERAQALGQSARGRRYSAAVAISAAPSPAAVLHRAMIASKAPATSSMSSSDTGNGLPVSMVSPNASSSTPSESTAG